MKPNETSFDFNAHIVLSESDPRCPELLKLFDDTARQLKEMGFDLTESHVPNEPPSVVH